MSRLGLLRDVAGTGFYVAVDFYVIIVVVEECTRRPRMAFLLFTGFMKGKAGHFVSLIYLFPQNLSR